MFKNVTLLHIYHFYHFFTFTKFDFSEVMTWAYRILKIHTNKQGNAKIHVKNR